MFPQVTHNFQVQRARRLVRHFPLLACQLLRSSWALTGCMYDEVLVCSHNLCWGSMIVHISKILVLLPMQFINKKKKGAWASLVYYGHDDKTDASQTMAGRQIWKKKKKRFNIRLHLSNGFVQSSTHDFTNFCEFLKSQGLLHILENAWIWK